MKPLYGEKTHPLTAHALGVLRSLLDGPSIRRLINPGCVNRLERTGLVREFLNPRDTSIRMIEITEAGKYCLASQPKEQKP